MKLRIYQDSIRFRVQVPEIEELLSKGAVEAFISLGLLPSNGLRYRISLNQVLSPQIEFSENGIHLTIPDQIGKDWCNSNEVGIYATQLVNDDRTLKIILEKDFKCLDDTFEDQTNMFPNPKDKC